MNTVIDSAVTETLLYHEQTKHHFHRYARSLGFLDWASQPNPFRLYEGVTAARLPLLQKGPTWKGFVQHGAKLVSGKALNPSKARCSLICCHTTG